jgi:hypothetical protein
MLYFVALLVPMSPVKDDTVAVIELNHVHGKDWDHRFDQFIFWEFKHSLAPLDDRPKWSYHVRDWCMAKPGEYRLRKEKGRWVLLLWDTRGGKEVLRKIEGASFRETSTNYDREVVERKRLIVERRRRLVP